MHYIHFDIRQVQAEGSKFEASSHAYAHVTEGNKFGTFKVHGHIIFYCVHAQFSKLLLLELFIIVFDQKQTIVITITRE